MDFPRGYYQSGSPTHCRGCRNWLPPIDWHTGGVCGDCLDKPRFWPSLQSGRKGDLQPRQVVGFPAVDLKLGVFQRVTVHFEGRRLFSNDNDFDCLRLGEEVHYPSVFSGEVHYSIPPFEFEIGKRIYDQGVVDAVGSDVDSAAAFFVCWGWSWDGDTALGDYVEAWVVAPWAAEDEGWDPWDDEDDDLEIDGSG